MYEEQIQLLPEKEFLKASRRKKILFLVFCALLLFTFVYSAGIGATPFSKKEIICILTEKVTGHSFSGMQVTAAQRDIFLQIRLPRVFLAALVGASLAVAGAAFQGLFRNPLADPYIIGVSSGAALGASLAVVTGLSLGLAGFSAVPLLAYAGGLATIILVYHVSRQGDAVPVLMLLLAGIAVSAFLSALVSLFIYFAGERLHQVVFWMMGGLGAAKWGYVRIMIPYFLVGFGVIYYFARELNALLLGEETASYLGIEVEKLKKIFLAAASLLVAAAVSTSGIIGFVGLVVPHMVRLVAGPDHRFLLPASALCGAILLIGADTLARTIIAPAELPVGIITAILGAPFFLYLLRRRRKIKYFDAA